MNERSYCLIITHGRSGSTLLKNILNTSKGCVIRGENNNFFYNCWISYKSLLKAHQFSPEWSGPYGSWDGIEGFRPQGYLRHVRKMALEFLLNEESSKIRVLGFKEIRYFADNDGFEMPLEHLSEYLNFLAEIFEPVSFVHLTRDLEEVKNSAWFRNQTTQNLLAKIPEFNKKVENIISSEHRYIKIDYSEIIDPKSERISELFNFLGIELDQNKLEYCLSVKAGVKRKMGN